MLQNVMTNFLLGLVLLRMCRVTSLTTTKSIAECTPTSSDLQTDLLELSRPLSHWKEVLLKQEKVCRLVPVLAKAGDRMCIFQACDIPYVIRPCDGGYSLLGDCYLHCLLYGEAIKVDHAPLERIWLMLN